MLCLYLEIFLGLSLYLAENTTSLHYKEQGRQCT